MVGDTGVGGGVTDRLRELRYNVKGLSFGEKAIRQEVRKRLGRSFDDADGCVLAFAGVRQSPALAPRSVGLRRSPWAVA